MMELGWSAQTVLTAVGIWFVVSSLCALLLARIIKAGQTPTDHARPLEMRESGIIPRVDRTSDEWRQLAEDFERRASAHGTAPERTDVHDLRALSQEPNEADRDDAMGQ